MNNITLVGFLSKDTESPTANLKTNSIAINTKFGDAEHCTFLKLKFIKKADKKFPASTLKILENAKGRMVMVNGQLQASNYQKGENTIRELILLVNSIAYLPIDKK